MRDQRDTQAISVSSIVMNIEYFLACPRASLLFVRTAAADDKDRRP